MNRWLAPPFDWKGISTATLWEAGVTRRRGCVRLPYRLESGDEWNAKLRSLQTDAQWWERTGCVRVPFGLEQLPDARSARSSILTLAEGESDALALRDAIAERHGRPVYHLGLPGACAWRQAWRAWVAPFCVVYVLGDGDQGGRRMIERVLRDVPTARPVLLPSGEDARSLVQQQGIDALDSCLDEADATAQVTAAISGSPTLAGCRQILREGGPHAPA